MAYQYIFGQVKKKAVLIYLKTLQAVRRSLVAAILIICFLQLMIFGFLGLVLTVIWILPADLNTKIYILLGFFSFIFFVPLMAVCFFLSERLWFRKSGAENFIKADSV